MLPQINNKSLLDCTADDFEVLVGNPDYRENQYLDYKEDFSFIHIPKDKAAPKIIEFRNDICSFANAEGGYIIYGIRDDQGIASEIVGVEIENPDKFELNLRNKLMPIMPKVPSIQFSFVKLENGRYIVVIFIEQDFYSPYIHIEDQKSYKIYKREGNQKTIVGYTELKNMFIKSRVLEDEILLFRKKTIDYYRSFNDNSHERFLIYHIIPESFLNTRKQLFLYERKEQQNYGAVFSGSMIDSLSLPCVDGLRYINTCGDEQGLLYNNGIAEFILPLGVYVGSVEEGEFFYNEDVWRFIDNISQGYRSIMPAIFGKQRYFACVSIIGCRNAIVEDNGYGRNKTRIDRNEIICPPVLFTDIEDADYFYNDLKKLHLEYLLALGIKRNENVSKLIEAISQFNCEINNIKPEE